MRILKIKQSDLAGDYGYIIGNDEQLNDYKAGLINAGEGYVEKDFEFFDFDFEKFKEDYSGKVVNNELDWDAVLIDFDESLSDGNHSLEIHSTETISKRPEQLQIEDYLIN